jgi:type IV secretory pathway TrbD component
MPCVRDDALARATLTVTLIIVLAAIAVHPEVIVWLAAAGFLAVLFDAPAAAVWLSRREHQIMCRLLRPQVAQSYQSIDEFLHPHNSDEFLRSIARGTNK